jgi:hypothetical protein
MEKHKIALATGLGIIAASTIALLIRKREAAPPPEIPTPPPETPTPPPSTEKYGLTIEKLSVEPETIHIQEPVTCTVVVKNWSSTMDYVVAWFSIDSIRRTEVMARRIYPGTEESAEYTFVFYEPGIYRIKCEITGTLSGATDTQIIEFTVLPVEFPNMFVLDPRPTHLYDFDDGYPTGVYHLQLPSGLDAQLLSIPKAEFKGVEFAMDITFNIVPSILSVDYSDGWYWAVWIFREDQDYTYPYIPYVPYGHRSGDPPLFSKNIPAKSITQASISKWALSLSSGTYPVVVLAIYRILSGGSYYFPERAWKVGQIVL